MKRETELLSLIVVWMLDIMDIIVRNNGLLDSMVDPLESWINYLNGSSSMEAEDIASVNLD